MHSWVEIVDLTIIEWIDIIWDGRSNSNNAESGRLLEFAPTTEYWRMVNGYVLARMLNGPISGIYNMRLFYCDYRMNKSLSDDNIPANMDCYDYYLEWLTSGCKLPVWNRDGNKVVEWVSVDNWFLSRQRASIRAALRVAVRNICNRRQSSNAAVVELCGTFDKYVDTERSSVSGCVKLLTLMWDDLDVEHEEVVIFR